MRKLLKFFTIFVLIFSLLIPLNNAYAESSEETDNKVEIEVNESLLNGNEPFSIIQDQNNGSDITPLAGSTLSVTLAKKSSGGLEGNWVFRTNSPVLRVNLTFTLQHKSAWYDLTWDNVSSVKHSYAGGQGFREDNQKTWNPTKKGQYRACASGTFTRVTGLTSAYGCSKAVTHDGSIIIAREKQS
ncbi:hypothetical protein [Metabacillus niabensis]|uniref:hypothetical protein n=1 Tax=Metabacillus niabensis TaxID=324854 RepID=UPI0039A0E7D4